ncbi:MAG: hypothetical protein ACKOD9_02255 [Rubrivivax sp.]
MLDDVYGPQRLLHEGLLPPALVMRHPGYVRALADAPLDARPVGRLDEQRQQFQRPGPRHGAFGPEDVVRHPVTPDLRGDGLQAVVEVGCHSSAGHFLKELIDEGGPDTSRTLPRRQVRPLLPEPAPGATKRAVGQAQFIPGTCIWRHKSFDQIDRLVDQTLLQRHELRGGGAHVF